MSDLCHACGQQHADAHSCPAYFSAETYDPHKNCRPSECDGAARHSPEWMSCGVCGRWFPMYDLSEVVRHEHRGQVAPSIRGTPVHRSPSVTAPEQERKEGA